MSHIPLWKFLEMQTGILIGLKVPKEWILVQNKAYFSAGRCQLTSGSLEIQQTEKQHTIDMT